MKKKRAPKIKKPGYADGTTAAGTSPDISKLTADQLAAYNKLTDPDAQQAYLQKVGQQNTSSVYNLGSTAALGVSGLLQNSKNKQIQQFEEAPGTSAVAPKVGADDIIGDALKGGGIGAKIGANPLLMGATGGLSAGIGTGAGALIGAFEGAGQARRDKTMLTGISDQKKSDAVIKTFQKNPAQDEAGVISLKDGGEVDDHIESMNNEHLAGRIKEIGREKALKEHADFFKEKKSRYSIKKKS